MARALRGLVGPLALLAVWELAAALGLLDRHYLPPPSVVLPRAIQLLTADSDFLLDTIATLLTFLIALGISALIAIPLGLLLGSARPARRAVLTVVEFLRPLPAVALLPLFMVLLGSGPETKITLATYAAVWPILFNTMYALDEMDPLYTDLARSFGFGRVRTAFTVALPHAAPFIATGIRICKEFGLEYVIVHGTEGHLIANELAREGARVITGPCLGDRSKPELANMSLETPVLLAMAGVKIAICTDHPETPVQYLPLCAAMAVKGGLPADAALAAITIWAAEIGGVAHRVGSLTPGKDGDVVVMSGHPLNWLSRVSAVVVDGRRVTE